MRPAVRPHYMANSSKKLCTTALNTNQSSAMFENRQLVLGWLSHSLPDFQYWTTTFCLSQFSKSAADLSAALAGTCAVRLSLPVTSCTYTVSEKNSQNCFWHNFVKFPPTLIILHTKMPKTILLCMVHSLTTSLNLCQCTTVWNTDAPNCYITGQLFVSDGSPLHHQFDRRCNVV